MKKTIENTNQIGEFLKKCRINAGLSTEQLAKKAGCSSQTINNTERNDRTINSTTLFIIATALKIKIKLTQDQRIKNGGARIYVKSTKA